MVGMNVLGRDSAACSEPTRSNNVGIEPFLDWKKRSTGGPRYDEMTEVEKV